MKKSIVTMGLVIALSVASTMSSFAGWEQTGTTWKYQNAGTYYNDGWHWIDGNDDGVAECYYFNTDGIMLSNTATPDNYIVDINGAWTVNGVVQIKVLGDNKSNSNNGNTEVKTPAPTQAKEEEPATEAPKTSDNSRFYNSDGSFDMTEIVNGVANGDPEAIAMLDKLPTSGNGANGNFDWN
ncbi:hypothetical protein [Hungatella hathewayi]